MPESTDESLQEDERQIMHRARDDLRAFAPLYERYFDGIYAYCLRRVDHPQEAEDLTSLIFSRALRNVGGYRDGSVRAWLFTIAHHTIANHYRDRKMRVALDDLPLIDPSHTPAEALLENERDQFIRSIVMRLPPEEQELLAMKINGELSAEEIGKVLDKSAGAVRVSLHRIIKRLRAVYLKELQ